LVGMVAIAPSTELLLISRLGYAKRLSVESTRLGHPGGLGTPVMQFAKKTDALITMLPIPSQGDILVSTDQNRVASLVPRKLPLSTKEGAGTLWLKLKAGEQLTSATLLSPS
jgi:DNA gyrase subunit A